MEFAQKLSALEERANRQLEVLDTEEKTKNALLLPFFEMLGYDPFNVQEVEPGPVVELGEDGRTEVDYAVHIDGSPVMLFQSKEVTVGRKAFEDHSLYKHLDELEASVVGLTNGLSYWFYTEVATLGGTNDLPFLKFDLFDYDPDQVTDLKRLTKTNFDAEEIFSLAFERQHTQLLEGYFAQQQEEPDEHFVRFIATQIHEGGVSEDFVGRLQPVVQEVLQKTGIDRDAGIQTENLDEDSSLPDVETDHGDGLPVIDQENSPTEDQVSSTDSTAQEDREELPPEPNDPPQTSEDEEGPDEEAQQESKIGQKFARKVLGE